MQKIKSAIKDFFLFLKDEEESQTSLPASFCCQNNRTRSSAFPLPRQSAPNKLDQRHSLCMEKLGTVLLNALGGKENIAGFKEIPNSRRIRITLICPEKICEQELSQLNLRFIIRIGSRIIHIIP